MATLQDAEAPFRTASDARPSGEGFTEAQTAAIAACVQAAASEAVEALRHDLVRWHAYLALYLLAQIGIVLLAALLMTDPPFPRPKEADAKRVGDALSVVQDSRFGTPLQRLDSRNLHRFAGRTEMPLSDLGRHNLLRIRDYLFDGIAGQDDGGASDSPRGAN